MTRRYATRPHGDFAVQVRTHDFEEIVKDSQAMAEMVALLDRYMVLHVSPEKELTKPVMGELAFALGYPKEKRSESRRPNPGPAVVPGYEFVADFGSTAKPNLPEPRLPSYIESLHYDGISGYSMQANFTAPPTTPNLWVDMRAAYRDLPAHLRKIVDTHHALHAVVPPPNTPLAEFPDFDGATARRRALVIKHPRTGQPLLYLPKNPASKVDGMGLDEGRAVLHDLWAHVNTSVTRYATMIGYNNLVVWDGLGTTHTNPAYPRDKDRVTWFLIVPGKFTEVESYFA
jgi:Taurine catabolism dioxygenase TauD, TfdA family